MRIFIIIGICLSSYIITNGQQRKFEKMGIQSTILHSSVSDILQDKNGFIWVAGGEGLGRYDGHNVVEHKHYKNIESSMCSNKVISICEAADGKIWIGTKGGLSMYDPETESTRCLFNEAKNVSRGDNIVLSVISDHKGFIWYSTYNGLYRFDPKSEKREVFRKDENDTHSISNNLIFSIFEDKDGVLWFANRIGISYCINDGDFQFVNFFPDPNNAYGLKHERFFTFSQTDNGDLWLGGDSGIYKIKDAYGEIQFINYPHDEKDKNSLSYNFVNHLMSDGKDLWASTWAGGLNKIVLQENDKKMDFTHYRNDKDNPYSLITDEVNVSLIDKSGVLWVGTGFGLMKSSPSKSKFGLIKATPNVPNSLSNNKVQATLVDSDGNLWVGTNHGLNFRSSKHKNGDTYFLNFLNDPNNVYSLCHNNVFELYEDSSRRIWIGTYSGFSIVDLDTFQKGKKFETLRFKKYPHNWIYNILESEKDVFWISTYGKLAKMIYPKGSEKPDMEIFDMDTNDPSALSNATTYLTCKDGKGRLWVGTFYGLSRINESVEGTTFQNFYKSLNEPGSISDVTIHCMFLDRNGHFWIGSSNGLNLLIEDDEGNFSFQTFDESMGLPNSMINFIEEDANGFLWIGTGSGVVQFDPIKAVAGQDPMVNVYTVDDGLGKNNTGRRSSCMDKKGNLYFGCDGLNYVNPNDLILNENIPDLTFTKLKVLNKEVAPTEKRILEKSIGIFGSEINLEHDDNMVEIFFSSLDYSNPKKNRYQYKMEGMNNDWVDSGNQNSATYTNLSAGTYTFSVVGSNNDGIWNDKPISLTINVAPHWSESKIAYAIYLLTGILLLGLYYRWRNLRAQEKIKIIKDIEIARFEERERLRKKNAADFHDELGHRLTKIALFLEIAKKQVNGNEKLSGYLDKVKTNTKSLSEGLKDLIWSLDPKKDTMLDTINRIQEVGDSIFDYSDMKFSTNAVDSRYGNMKLSPTERKHILLILKKR